MKFIQLEFDQTKDCHLFIIIIIIQMSSILLSLYHKRLESLDKTINSLHQTIENDPALNIMDAPQLLRFKIDRVNELVKQIFNSQKQQIIIYLLNMCENATQKKSVKDYQYQGKQNTFRQLENEIKMFREETQMLKRQLIEEKQKCNQYKFQIQQFQIKQKEFDQSFIQRQTQYQRIEKQLKQQKLFLKEKENTILSLLQKSQKIQKENSVLREQLENQSIECRNYKIKVQEVQTKLKQKVQSMRVKVQRIESLKKQMGSLFTHLHCNKEMIFTLKQSIGSIIKNDLQELRKDCQKLKFELVNVFFKTIQSGFQQIKKECQNKNVSAEDKAEKQREVLLQHMNQIQKEMESFISNKIKNI